MMEDYIDLTLNLDGSYTFVKNGLPYNCPNTGEWEGEFADVDAWAKEHPNEVQHEQPAPDPTFDELRARKRAEIAAARYDYEIAGVIINGVHITTDREDQAMITAVALSAVVDQTYTTVWKGADGYLTLNAAEILAMARIVGAHVEAAFAEEKRLAALIDAAQTQEDLDAVVWQDPD